MSRIINSANNRVVGGLRNFWIWSKDDGFDLTHPDEPNSPRIFPRVPLQTTKETATFDPRKTALVVIDMQNYFLSPQLGRPITSTGLAVVQKLVQTVIPACRKAGIPVLWLGWGLTEEDLSDVPPSIACGFSFSLDTNFQDGKPRDLGGLGADMGELELDDGRVIDAGRVLMRKQWNSDFYPPLTEEAEPQDMFVYKNRLSGFWGGTDAETTLRKRGIRSLLFAGENTDQCVQGSMQDAYEKGWDVIMLKDVCSTNSPKFATECIEFNCENGWGFLATSAQLAEGIRNMQQAPSTEDLE